MPSNEGSVYFYTWQSQEDHCYCLDYGYDIKFCASLLCFWGKVIIVSNGT